jgi:hypothetical protein
MSELCHETQTASPHHLCWSSARCIRAARGPKTNPEGLTAVTIWTSAPRPSRPNQNPEKSAELSHLEGALSPAPQKIGKNREIDPVPAAPHSGRPEKPETRSICRRWKPNGRRLFHRPQPRAAKKSGKIEKSIPSRPPHSQDPQKNRKLGAGKSFVFLSAWPNFQTFSPLEPKRPPTFPQATAPLRKKSGKIAKSIPSSPPHSRTPRKTRCLPGRVGFPARHPAKRNDPPAATRATRVSTPRKVSSIVG